MPATQSQNVIDVKEAVRIASRHLHSLFPSVRHGDVALEEVELSENNWEITLSFMKKRQKGLTALFVDEGLVYKKFGVDKNTGEVVFMRIRKP